MDKTDGTRFLTKEEIEEIDVITSAQRKRNAESFDWIGIEELKPVTQRYNKYKAIVPASYLDKCGNIYSLFKKILGELELHRTITTDMNYEVQFNAFIHLYFNTTKEDGTIDKRQCLFYQVTMSSLQHYKKYLVKQVKDIMNMTNVSCYPGYEKENFIVDTLTCCGLHSNDIVFKQNDVDYLFKFVRSPGKEDYIYKQDDIKHISDRYLSGDIYNIVFKMNILT